MSSERSAKQSRRRSPYERPIVYDREILIEICTRLLQGEDLGATCAKPPMPRDVVFLGWIQDHQEARAIYRSLQNFQSDRLLAKVLGTVLVVSARLASRLHRPRIHPAGLEQGLSRHRRPAGGQCRQHAGL